MTTREHGQVTAALRAIYDLFAAGGGWDYGLELVGEDPRLTLGWEWSTLASTTARLAGYARVVADVAKMPVDAITERPKGVTGSPPCQTFSTANGGPGRQFLRILLWAIEQIGRGHDPRHIVIKMTEDLRSVLVLEPLRWVLHLRPSWMAWEQVPAVQPIWDAAAIVLRAHGYSVYTGVLNAVQYDVPQSRKRAVLLASREQEVLKPAPVRSLYHPSNPSRIDAGLERWLTIGDVLPHRVGQSLVSNYGTGGDPKKRGIRRWDQPAATVTGKIDRFKWSDGTAVSTREASVLQTFSADHPWYGERSGDIAQQVGDAVPPMLAAHCYAALGVGDLDRARAIHLGLERAA